MIQVYRKSELTGDASVALEHPFDVRLTALECVEVADKHARIHSLGILRVCLVPHLTHLHCAFGRHGPFRLQKYRKEFVRIAFGRIWSHSLVGFFQESEEYNNFFRKLTLFRSSGNKYLRFILSWAW